MARTFVGLPGENVVDVRGAWLGVEPERLLDLWMDSPGHRENILRDSYTHVGLGVCQAGARTIAVACFGQRFAELEAPAPFAATAADIAQALAGATPAIHAYDLSPIGADAPEGDFSEASPSARLPKGSFVLRPKLLQSGRRYTIVYGPIVELNG